LYPEDSGSRFLHYINTFLPGYNGITSQKTVIFLFRAVRTENLAESDIRVLPVVGTRVFGAGAEDCNPTKHIICTVYFAGISLALFHLLLDIVLLLYFLSIYFNFHSINLFPAKGLQM
jgi:hypothetical protein